MTTTTTQFITTATSMGTTSLYKTSANISGKTDNQLSKETTMSEPSNTANKTTTYTQQSTYHTTTLTTVDMRHETDRQELSTDALTTLTVISYSDATKGNINNSAKPNITETSTTMKIPTKTGKTSLNSSNVSHKVQSTETDMSTPEASVMVSERFSLPSNASTTQVSTSSYCDKHTIPLFYVTIVVIFAYLAPKY